MPNKIKNGEKKYFYIFNVMRKNKQVNQKKKKSKSQRNKQNGLRGFRSNYVVQIRKVFQAQPRRPVFFNLQQTMFKKTRVWFQHSNILILWSFAQTSNTKNVKHETTIPNI